MLTVSRRSTMRTSGSITRFVASTVHLYLYSLPFQNPRGMCTNLDLHSTAPADLSEEDLARQKPVLVPLSDLEGNPFEHFDDLFWDAGGRVGGW